MVIVTDPSRPLHLGHHAGEDTASGCTVLFLQGTTSGQGQDQSHNVGDGGLHSAHEADQPHADVCARAPPHEVFSPTSRQLGPELSVSLHGKDKRDILTKLSHLPAFSVYFGHTQVSKPAVCLLSLHCRG